MHLPSCSHQPFHAIYTAAQVVYTAICTATTAVFLALLSLVHRVKTAVMPIFTPHGVAENGSVGSTPFSPAIRLLYVNGVGTRVEKCRRTAHAISSIFNNSLVHYTYVPLRYDQVVRTIMYGYRPPACDLLLANIRERLRDIHAAEQQRSERDQRVEDASQRAIAQTSKLIIFVHSGGGALLEAIRDELTVDEKRQIDVYSFGSAHLFSPDEGFDTVKNVVASGDPIPTLCRLMDRRIYPLGKPWNIGGHTLLNVSRHSMLHDIYQLSLWHIKENYV